MTCIVCGSPTGPTGEGMDWSRVLAERDRLQAENTQLVAALRATLEAVPYHRLRRTVAQSMACDRVNLARALLAAHDART